MSELVMNQSTKPLPSFEDPPVNEVVLGVQFDPIKGLHTPQIGLLWQEFKERLPVTEEYAPLEPVIERFGAKYKAIGGVQFQMLDAPPTPRCWFLNEAGTELIQVQPDRFVRNWRKLEGTTEYPRYEKTLRPAFINDFSRFAAFIEREKLGEIVPNQCEVTYVNLIDQDHGQIEKVMAVFSQRYSDDFLKAPEDMRAVLRYIISDATDQPIGRLTVSLEPIYRVKDDSPGLRLSLTARGQPEGAKLDGVLRFMDIGREWIVRGFASITTNEMHAIWRRQP